jgi:hypothetical protein
MRLVHMVADHGRNLDRDGAPTKAFGPRLFLWATSMIRPAQDRAIGDADLKRSPSIFRPVARYRRDRHQL